MWPNSAQGSGQTWPKSARISPNSAQTRPILGNIGRRGRYCWPYPVNFGPDSVEIAAISAIPSNIWLMSAEFNGFGGCRESPAKHQGKALTRLRRFQSQSTAGRADSTKLWRLRQIGARVWSTSTCIPGRIWPNSAEVHPVSARCVPCFSDSGLMLVKLRHVSSKFGRFRPKRSGFGPSASNTGEGGGQIRPTSVQFAHRLESPNQVDIAQPRQTPGRCVGRSKAHKRLTSADSGPHVHKLGTTSTNIGRVGPESAKFGPSLADLGPTHRPISTRVGQGVPKMCLELNHWPKSSQTRPQMEKVDPDWPGIGQTWPGIGRTLKP